MMKPPETKISKAQYRTLLRRSMDSTPVADQQSQALQMQQMFGQMMQPQMPMQQPGMSGMMPQQEMAPPSPSPQTQMPGSDPAMQAEQPMAPNIPPTQDTGQLLQNAAQMWQEIQAGLGGQLWARLAQSMGDTDPDPSKSFVQAAVVFQQNPEGIANDRIKQFLASLFPQQPSAVTPQGAEEDPLTALISQHLE